MELDIKITSFRVEIKPVVRKDNIKAFAAWFFETSLGEWKITGGTIRLKTFGKYDVSKLTFDGPAFSAGFKYYKVLFIDNKDLYRELCHYTIKKYGEETGEVIDEATYEDIDPETIPI